MSPTGVAATASHKSGPDRLTRVAAGVVLCVAGVVVALGWLGGIPSVRSLVPGWPEMTVTTATLLSLAALALALPGRSAWGRRVVTGLVVAGTALALWALSDLAGTLGVGLSSPPSTGTSVSTLALLLAAGALRARDARVVALAPPLGLVALLLPLYQLVSLPLRGPAQVGATLLDTMALHTALCAGLLAVGGVILHPRLDVRALLLRRGGPRRTLLAAATAALVGPIVVAQLALLREGAYPRGEDRVLLVAVAVGMLSMAVTWYAIVRAHRAEQARAREAERRRAVIVGSPVAKLLVDPAGAIRFANPSAAGLFGREDLAGLPVEELVPAPLRAGHAGQRDAFAGEREARRMGRQARDVQAVGPGGRLLTVEVTLTPLGLDDGPMTLASVVDVTEQRRLAALERERIEALTALNAELSRSNDALQQFAYAASHDLQEPLRMVASYVQLIEKRYRDLLDERGQTMMGFAVDGAKRMQTLVDGLLAYARATPSDRPPEPVAMTEACREALALLHGGVEESAATIEIDDGMPTVLAHPVTMIQLWQNLVANAIQHRGAGPPRIRVGVREVGARTATFFVADEGPGVPSDRQERIFDLFQRLDRRQGGTGLGLALCKRVVEDRGGRIWVESDGAHGSTFLFTLPLAEVAAT